MPQLGPRVSEKTMEWLKSHFQTKNAGGEYLIEIVPKLYANTLHDMAGRFNKSELSLILDVVNGLYLTPNLAGLHVMAECEDGIRLNALDTKWGIDSSLFLAKLSSLTVVERVMLEIWACGFWAGGHWERENGLEEWCQPFEKREV